MLEKVMISNIMIGGIGNVGAAGNKATAYVSGTGGNDDKSRRSAASSNTERWTESHSHSFPVLYNTDSKGKVRYWKLSVNGCVLHKESGCVGTPRPIKSSRTIYGKNAGKKNETTNEQQALLTAQKDFASQLDKQYKPDVDKMTSEELQFYTNMIREKEKHGNSNFSVTDAGKEKHHTTDEETYTKNTKPIKPMLCHKWSDSDNSSIKHFKLDTKTGKFQDIVFVQPKYDGYRAIARWSDSKLILTSRNNKQYVWLSHIRKELNNLFEKYPNLVLDGEIYEHKITGSNGSLLEDEEKFGFISSVCKMNRVTPHPEEIKLSYYIYDLIDESKQQSVRLAALTKLFNNTNYRYLKLSETHPIQTLSELYKLYEKYIEDGYEGVIMRTFDNHYYLNQRSLKVRKFKPEDDMEVLIVGIKKDPGLKGDEHFSWKCKLPKVIQLVDGYEFDYEDKPFDGVECDVAPGRFSKELRERMYKERDKIIGRVATIYHQGYTKPIEENGKPRFPRFKGVRTDINVD